MHYEVLSASKSKNGARVGDDVTLFIPGVVAAVFDGATDPLGQKINDVTSGRFAAETVALTCTRLFSDPSNLLLPLPEILEYLTQSLSENIRYQGFEGTPSTTLAMALFMPEAVRMIVVGDSGIRVNQKQVLRHEKMIDAVTTAARVAVFARLSDRIDDPDNLEAVTRSVAFLGFSRAVADGVLSKTEAENIDVDVQRRFAKLGIAEDISNFLSAGIKSQKFYANLSAHPLGFSAINGTPTSLDDVIDSTSQSNTVHTLEIFSDGYASLPNGRLIADWEATHRGVEMADFHKINQFRSVKGSTSTEYFDDRSIVSIEM
jgi:hypothetical protein